MSADDPETAKQLCRIAQELRERKERFEHLQKKVQNLESMIAEYEKQQEALRAFTLNPILTKLPVGLRKGVTEAAVRFFELLASNTTQNSSLFQLPLILQSMKFPKDDQETLLKTIASQASGNQRRSGSQRHPVWAGRIDVMIAEFEHRLETLINQSDLDKDGVIDKNEFKQMALDFLKYELKLREGDEVSADDVRDCEKRAEREFRQFDKNKDGLMEAKEMRAFFEQQVELQAVDAYLDHHYGNPSRQLTDLQTGCLSKNAGN